MTLNIVNVRDNSDCYKFELSTFINEMNKFLESGSELLSFKDFVFVVIKSYGIIGNTVTLTLMNVMSRDINNKKYPDLIRNGIESTLCFLMHFNIRKRHPDADLTNMTKVIEEKWTAILREIEQTEV